MKLLFWQKNQLVKNFAHTLANDLASRLNAQRMNDYLVAANSTEKKTGTLTTGNDKKSMQQFQDVQRRLTEIILQVRQFKTNHALGVYRKARLHQQFESRLTELGYPPELARDVNRLILLQTP